jgi:site-specific recombinase XerD
MFDLVKSLQEKFPEKFPKYISRIEMINFLNIYRGKFGSKDFESLKKYYESQSLNRSRIFREWETENKVILKHNDILEKENRTYPFEKEFKELLELRRYSFKTIKAYSSSVMIANEFLLRIEKVNISEASKEQLQNYFYFLTNEKKVSCSKHRISRFAIEYYLNEIVLKPIRLDFAYGIRGKEHLPTIFSKSEVLKILDSTYNLKHRLILSLLYSSGLRLSEVIHLRVKDIDLEEKTIRVREGKGNKDRISVLSDKLINDLKIFCSNRKPNDILFPSNQQRVKGKDSYLSPRTVEKIFENCLLKSGIKKKGSPHSFRHSFATHLLEAGTDIHFIQKLLGHKNLSTTTIYTKLANPKLAGIKSPL